MTSSHHRSYSRLVEHYHVLVATICEIAERYLYQARVRDAVKILANPLLQEFEYELTDEDKVRLGTQWARMMSYQRYFEPVDYAPVLTRLALLADRARTLADESLLADVMDATGTILYAQEWQATTLDDALDHFQQALELRKALGDTRGIAESLFNVGTVYQNKAGSTPEDRDRAVAYFQEAYAVAERGNHPLEQSYAARHLGFIHLLQNNTEQALAYQKESLALREKMGFRLFLAPAHTMIGIAYHTSGDMSRASEHFRTAETLAQEIGSKHFLAEALYGIGMVNEAHNDTIAALRSYQEALGNAQAVKFAFIIGMITRRIERLTQN